ncbi:response regulator [Micromonospora sp. NPDC005189]|uniref:response regulator n=1 Tax=unclassified Micromonospora TaxID=2617518 RepID=UPI0033A8B6D0
MADILGAAAALAWPILVIVTLIYLLPAARRLLSDSQSVDVEVGGARISVQSASDETRKLIEDLQDKVNDLSARVGELPAGVHAHPAIVPAPPRILWVDDELTGNVYERARAADGGYDIVQAATTDSALKLLSSAEPTVIVSDMGRMENGRFNPTAGLDLVRELRRNGDQTPVVFYGSSRRLAQLQEELDLIAGVSYTASPTELAQILRV